MQNENNKTPEEWENDKKKIKNILSKYTELNKLEEYLEAHGYQYDRVDHNFGYAERHQIIVYEKHRYKWDAICHFGSYGNEQYLLEVMGCIVPKFQDVMGWLTADDIIYRLEHGEWKTTR